MSGVWAADGLDGAGPGEDRADREQPDAVDGPHRGEAAVGGGGRARDRHPAALARSWRCTATARPAPPGKRPGERHLHPDDRADPPAEVDRRGQQRAAVEHGAPALHGAAVGDTPPAARSAARRAGTRQREQRDGPSSCEQAAQGRGDAARIVHA